MKSDKETSLFYCPICKMPWEKYWESGMLMVEKHPALTPYGLIKRRCPDCGTVQSRESYEYTEDMKLYIAQLHSEGYPHRIIRDTCGLSNWTVQTYKNYKGKVKNENTAD